MGKRGPRPTGKKSYVGLFAFDYPSEFSDDAIQIIKQADPASRTRLVGNWYLAWRMIHKSEELEQAGHPAKEQTSNE